MNVDQTSALADALKGQEAQQIAIDEFNAAIADRSPVQAPIQVPSIGRVVLYLHTDGRLLPGLVIEVLDHDTFEVRIAVLGVLAQGGLGFLEPQYFEAPYDAAGTKVGCWSWPPRV